MSGLLLSPLATFLLGIGALLKSFLLLGNPIKRRLRQNEGKTDLQVEAEFEEAWEEDRTNVIIEEAWRWEYLALVLLFTFVIDPFLVIVALTRNIGYQPISYTMLLVVAIDYFIWLRNFFLAAKASNGEQVDEAELESVVPTRWITLAEKVRINELARYWIRRIFGYIRAFYLWYLLLAVLGILP